MDTQYVRQVVIDSLRQFGADSTHPIWETLVIADGRYLGRQFEFYTLRAIWFWDRHAVEFFDKNSILLVIELPEPALEQSVEAGACRRESFAPLCLLLVDDEPRIVDKLEDLLQCEGFEVQVAYDGKQAVETALASQPDVFILDLGMPNVDGFQLADLLRTTLNCVGKRFIALAGYSDQQHLDQGTQSGFDEYLVKPGSWACSWRCWP